MSSKFLDHVLFQVSRSELPAEVGSVPEIPELGSAIPGAKPTSLELSSGI